MKAHICFVLAFFLEVHIRAENIHNLGLARFVPQKPANCLVEERFPCAVRTKKNEKLKVAAALILGEKTTIVLKSHNSAELVSGYAWVRAKNEYMIQTESFDVTSKGGEYWLIRNNNFDTLRNISSHLVVQTKGKPDYHLPFGFETDVYPFNPFKKYSEIELPRAINIEQHINLWGKMYSGSKRDFYVEVKYFKPIWKNAVKQSSKLYQKISDRNIASLKDREKKYRRWRKKYDKETSQILDEFRKRNHFE